MNGIVLATTPTSPFDAGSGFDEITNALTANYEYALAFAGLWVAFRVVKRLIKGN